MKHRCIVGAYDTVASRPESLKMYDKIDIVYCGNYDEDIDMAFRQWGNYPNITVNARDLWPGSRIVW